MNFSQRAVSIRNFTKANLQSKTVSLSDTIIKNYILSGQNTWNKCFEFVTFLLIKVTTKLLRVAKTPDFMEVLRLFFVL